MENIPRPTIGLLNVGTEDIKGNEVVKATGQLLKADHERGKLNFFGNVEGNDIFKGTVDVIVCDGFVGNVTLKAIEGLSRFFKSVFKESVLSMAGALLARKSLKKLNPERYNGAGLLGLKGLVFKSHGGANAFAFEWALKRAYDAAKYDVQEQLSALIAELMPTPPDAQRQA
jgi:glycerol-3-phosphate acyltransferase PlsX